MSSSNDERRQPARRPRSCGNPRCRDDTCGAHQAAPGCRRSALGSSRSRVNSFCFPGSAWSPSEWDTIRLFFIAFSAGWPLFLKDERPGPIPTSPVGDQPPRAMTDRFIYTIGHSNHPLEHFLGLLRRHGITALADVRSTPYSRFNPQFRRDALATVLGKNGVEYVFLGEQLGARSKDRSCYGEGGRVSYARLAASELFRQGIERLLELAHIHRVALMCAEKDPLDCHRTILVTRELVKQRASVMHILAAGEVESHTDAMARLRRKLKIQEAEDLFGRDADEAAYEVRGRQIAYVDPKAGK